MKFYARSFELPMYVRDMHGRLCIIRQQFLKPSTYYISMYQLVTNELYEFEK